jgi:DNA-binding response OmpR family regulator
MQKKILLIEDNETLIEGTRRVLNRAGYSVKMAKTLGEAREVLRGYAPEVILLDVMLPDGDGFEFCGEIRPETDAHILFLTSRKEQEDRMRGLDSGGDDYIIKPFRTNELLARVAAAMRRREMSEAPHGFFMAGNMSLDIIARIAYVDGKDLLLSAKEFAILLFLAQNKGEILGVENIFQEVWGMPIGGDSRTLRKHISELRGKMTNAGCTYSINSVYGQGYRFEEI